MDTAINFAAIGAALALGAVLVYHAFDTWRRGEALPFFQMLKRYGLSLPRIEEVAGREALAAAQRRCAHCPDRRDCALALACNRFGRGPLACRPNAAFFEQVKGAELQHT
jgi:hypothetical protein